MTAPSRALSAALVVSLTVAAACSSSDRSETPTAASPVPTTSVPVPADPGAGTTSTVALGPTTRGPGPAIPTTVRPSPGAAPGEIGQGSLDVGRLAPFLLRPGNGERIVVEVRAQQGAAPTQPTLEHVVRVLAAASRKAVTIDGPEVIEGAGQEWNEASIAALADRRADFTQGGDQVVVRLLFLRGSFRGDGSILGASVRRDVAAIFTDRTSAAGGLFANPDQILEATTIHEVGHLLGLVDLVVGAGRGDPEHPGHSRNPRSVMYWAVESGSIAQIFGASIPTELDDDDRAELAAIRNG